jgi:inward rectifier potassium channel
LADKTSEYLQEYDAEILVLLTGYAETFSQTVETRSSYKYSEIEWGSRFNDLYSVAKDGRLSIDMNELSTFEKAELPEV